MRSKYPGLEVYTSYCWLLHMGQLEVTLWMPSEHLDEFVRTELYQKLMRNGPVGIIRFCAGNISYSVGLCCGLKCSEWSELEELPLFRDLAEYAMYLHPQKPDTHTEPHEPECKVENSVSKENAVNQRRFLRTLIQACKDILHI